jgi:hypothetical protein
LLAGSEGEERDGVGLRKQVEGQGVAVVQPGEAVPAGDDHDAAGRPRQQRRQLCFGRRIVEHDQRPVVGELAAVQRCAVLLIRWDLLGGHAEGAEDPIECLGRFDRTHASRVSVQVEDELLVGVAGCYAVGGLDGEGGRADAGHAADRCCRVSVADVAQGQNHWTPKPPSLATFTELARVFTFGERQLLPFGTTTELACRCEREPGGGGRARRRIVGLLVRSLEGEDRSAVAHVDVELVRDAGVLEQLNDHVGCPWCCAARDGAVDLVGWQVRSSRGRRVIQTLR